MIELGDQLRRDYCAQKVLGVILLLSIIALFRGAWVEPRPVSISEEINDHLEHILIEQCDGGQLDQECLDKITVLNIPTRSLESLRGLGYCRNLVHLDVSAQYMIDRTSFYRLKDLGALPALKKLEWLDISSNALPRADFLQGLTRLRYLDAGANEFYDFSSFTRLPALETFDLHNNGIMRIQGFGTTTMLRDLDLSGNPLVVLEGLESLEHLEHLDIRGTHLPADRVKEITETLRARGVAVDS